MLSIPRVAKILTYLPEYVRHGVFAAIGIAVAQLGFESFELDMFDAVTWASGENLLKWIPAYILGGALWYMDEHYSSRWLILGFFICIIACVHVVLVACGMPLHEAAKRGLLLGEVAPRGLSEYFQMTYGSLGIVDWQTVAANLHNLFLASLVGPVLNVSINVVVVEAMCRTQVSYAREFLAHSLGLLANSLGFGFNAYIAAADTSLMRKAGGKNGRPVVMMCAMMACVCIVPPILPIISLTIPVLLPATVFVFVGLAIAIGCFNDMRSALPQAEFVPSLMTCAACVMTSVAKGMFMACAVCAIHHMCTSPRDAFLEEARSVQPNATGQASRDECTEGTSTACELAPQQREASRSSAPRNSTYG